MGEASPLQSAEDITGEDERMYYYSALKIRMRCAERGLDAVNQQHARWRAKKLRQKLDDADDESHLGIVLRKRFKNPSETPQMPREPFHGECGDGAKSSSERMRNSVDMCAGKDRKAPLAFHRWRSLLSATRTASRAQTLPSIRECSPEEIFPEDKSPAASDRMWHVRSLGISCTTTERQSRQPPTSPVSRMFGWAKRNRARVHVSFDSVVSDSTLDT
eukprot:TRINITY_DN18853_c0_g1_i1.p1 TRINITY_DN18853_c0_g1~~TRINITY_DN18853_c0_g1_i1.p1  ORF type:complete len:218 (-),score=17.02 TRINITY_DN18853_c0_g1_i1:423-1076(-)